MQRWQKRQSRPQSSAQLTPLQPHKLEPSRPDQRSLGRLPIAGWLAVLSHASLPDVLSLRLSCRSLNALANNNKVWQFKLALLHVEGLHFNHAQQQQQQQSPEQSLSKRKSSLNKKDADDFGEFVDAPLDDADLLKFDSSASGPDGFPLSPSPPSSHQLSPHRHSTVSGKQAPAPASSPFQSFKHLYSNLVPFYASLQTHTTSSLLFTQQGLSPVDRAHIFRALAHLLLPPCSPSRSAARNSVFKRNLTSSKDFFESTLFSDFERASKRQPESDEAAMAKCAHLVWQLGLPSAQSLFDVFLNAREIFYESSHNPHWNIVRGITPSQPTTLDFSAMENYMQYVIDTAQVDGGLARRVFPPQMDVVRDYADRVAQDAVSCCVFCVAFARADSVWTTDL